MFWLPEPPFVEGGRWIFDPTCYAAALSTWQAVTDNRVQETVQEIETRLSRPASPLMKRSGKLSLDAAKFDIFAAASNIQMAWRPIRGADLIKWDLELSLQLLGYMYLVVYLGESERNGRTSHARVLFGAFAEFKTAYFMDPAAGSIIVNYKDMASQRFLIAVPRERVPSWEDGWQNAPN